MPVDIKILSGRNNLLLNLNLETLLIFGRQALFIVHLHMAEMHLSFIDRHLSTVISRSKYLFHYSVIVKVSIVVDDIVVAIFRSSRRKIVHCRRRPLFAEAGKARKLLFGRCVCCLDGSQRHFVEAGPKVILLKILSLYPRGEKNRGNIVSSHKPPFCSARFFIA